MGSHGSVSENPPYRSPFHCMGVRLLSRDLAANVSSASLSVFPFFNKI